LAQAFSLNRKELEHKALVEATTGVPVPTSATGCVRLVDLLVCCS